MMTIIISTGLTLVITMSLLLVLHMTKMKSFLDREKSSAFECGFDPISKARLPFSTRFFMLAVVFIIFDIEIMILMPIPILMKTSMFIKFGLSSLIFIIVLSLGLFHEWNEGTLNWSL